VAAVPAERLAKLVATFSADAAIEIELLGGVLAVRCDGSQCMLSALPAGDFPLPLAIKAPYATYKADAKALKALFSLPLTVAMGEDITRAHMLGVSLQNHEGSLAAVATDGLALALLRTAIPAGDLPAGGVILPPRARAEIFALLARAKGDVELAISDRLIEVRTEHAVYCSKLIAARFPDYRRIVPPRPAASAEIGSGILLPAATRLLATSTATIPAVADLSWDETADANAVRLELAHEPGAAVDVVAGVVHGSGRVAVQAGRLLDLVDALKAKTVRISASQPIRIESVDRSDVLMLLATTAWAKPDIRRAAA
jgi:DNA polymerase III sliding clamp (beta) subunit (PCNA family)